MDKPISNNLRNLFLLHMIVTGVIGAAIWLTPGRVLQWVGWVPEMRSLSDEISVPGTMLFDPFLARILGAVLLAMAVASFRGWRASQWREVQALVWMESAFGVLGAVGLLYTASRAFNPFQLPLIHWVILALLVVFGAAWLFMLRQHRS